MRELSLWGKKRNTKNLERRHAARRMAGQLKEKYSGIPIDARRIIGGELQLVQYGGMPRDAKPLKGIGSGVLEIAIRHEGEAYRTVVALQLGITIYVLHAFQKKSKKASPRRSRTWI